MTNCYNYLRNILCICILFITLFRCDSNVIGKLKSDYEGDKITLTGFLTTDTILLIIGKSTEAFGNVSPDEFKAKNPQVFIESEDGHFRHTFFSSDGIHFSAGKIGLLAEKSYKLTVTAADLPTVETAFIEIPENITIENLKTIAIPGSGRITNEISFSIQDKSNPNYYFFDVGIQKGTSQNTAPFWVPEDGIADNCYSVFAFQDLCFNGKVINLTYRLSPDGYFKGFNGLQVADSIIIRFGGVSKEVYLSQLAVPIDDGFIEGINEPPLTYSNVKNGYGVVFAHSLQDYVVTTVK